MQIERYQPGLLARLAERTEAGVVRKAGVMSVVLSGGPVSPGDRMEIELPSGAFEQLTYLAPGAGRGNRHVEP